MGGACPRCGTWMVPGDAFCVNCGLYIGQSRRMGSACPKCGTWMVPGDVFCVNCGSKLDAADTLGPRIKTARLNTLKRPDTPVGGSSGTKTTTTGAANAKDRATAVITALIIIALVFWLVPRGDKGVFKDVKSAAAYVRPRVCF